MTNNNWLIYGAYGYTGKIIATEAVKKGYRPILVGRSKQKLLPIAEKLGLEWLELDLADKDAVELTLSKVGLVLNAAGPFGETVKPLVEACLIKGVHYLDIANEVAVYQLLLAFDKAARNRGVALISGVGFGTVATNFVAKKVVELVPDTTNLTVGIVPYNYTTESAAGANKTALEVIAGGGKVYKGGKLIPTTLGRGAIYITTPDGAKHSVLPIPLGDLSAAYLVTGVMNVVSYVELPISKITQFFLPLLHLLLKIDPLKKMLENQVGRSGSKPALDKEFDESRRSYAWASATNKQGEERTIWLETGEGYEFTAKSSVRAVEQVLALQPKGTLTPAQAFEANFVLGIKGVNELNLG